MRRLVYIPLDATSRLLETGFSMEQIEESYNPGGWFDEVYVISLKDRVKDYKSLKFIKANISEVAEYISEIKPDAVRSNAGFYCSSIAAACRVKGIPYMVSVHDSSVERIEQSIYFADKIVYVSNAVKKSIQSIVDVEEEQMLYLPRWIDLNIFSKKENRELFTRLDRLYLGKKHIISVGRRSYEKNIEKTIEAFKYLPDDYVLLQIGLGDASPYRKIAEEMGIEDRVFFLEGIPQEQLAFFYSWADCMCAPSRWEGFGLVFIEACACECPVITTNIDPMNEYLTDEESALLVNDPDNAKEIADKIIRVCSDEVLRLRLVQGGTIVSKKFSKEIAAEKEIENYKIMLSDYDNLKENELKKTIKKLTLPFVIYGAGKNGMDFYKQMKQLGRKPLYFVDNDENKKNAYIDDIKIITHEYISMIEDDFVVVVTPSNDFEIIKRLKEENIEFIESYFYGNLMYNCVIRDSEMKSKWL